MTAYRTPLLNVWFIIYHFLRYLISQEAVFLTILREPVSQFESQFTYYKLEEGMPIRDYINKRWEVGLKLKYTFLKRSELIQLYVYRFERNFWTVQLKLLFPLQPETRAWPDCFVAEWQRHQPVQHTTPRLGLQRPRHWCQCHQVSSCRKVHHITWILVYQSLINWKPDIRYRFVSDGQMKYTL